jgi:lysophospholipase L1-like esterase
MLTSGAFGYLADYLLWWTVFLSLLVHAWCFFRFFPRAKHRRAGLVLGNLLIFLCLLGTAGIIGETYFRFLAVHTDPFGVSLPARRWFALYTDLNSLGCRAKEWSKDKPAGVRRIAFVGDSFTYGWGVENPEHRFTDLLQQRFDSRALGTVEVMNVALPGWSTLDQLRRLPDFISQYDVDEVVLCYVANDIEELIPTSSDFNPTRPPEPTFFNPDSSPLVDYLYRRIVVPRRPTVRGYVDWLADAYKDPKISGQQGKNLHELANICREAGVQFRIVLLPYIQAQSDPRHARLHSGTSTFLALNDMQALDLAPTLAGHDPRDLVVSALDAHPNAKAHALFAEAIWRAYYQKSP